MTPLLIDLSRWARGHDEVVESVSHLPFRQCCATVPGVRCRQRTRSHNGYRLSYGFHWNNKDSGSLFWHFTVLKRGVGLVGHQCACDMPWFGYILHWVFEGWRYFGSIAFMLQPYYTSLKYLILLPPSCVFGLLHGQIFGQCREAFGNPG